MLDTSYALAFGLVLAASRTYSCPTTNLFQRFSSCLWCLLGRNREVSNAQVQCGQQQAELSGLYSVVPDLWTARPPVNHVAPQASAHEKGGITFSSRDQSRSCSVGGS